MWHKKTRKAHADTWYSTMTHTAHADTCSTLWHIRHTLTHDTAHGHIQHTLTHAAHEDTYGTLWHMIQHTDTYTTHWHIQHTLTHTAHADTYRQYQHTSLQIRVFTAIFHVPLNCLKLWGLKFFQATHFASYIFLWAPSSYMKIYTPSDTPTRDVLRTKTKKFEVSATSGSSSLKPMFSLLPNFLQKTEVRFCRNLCQLFPDLFWRHREGRKTHRTDVRKCPHGVTRVTRSLCCPQMLNH